jgi:hypothetical protein
MLYNNQQDVQAAGEDAKIQVTTWYLLLHTSTLGFILGIMNADRASIILGSWFLSAAWSRSPCFWRCDFAWIVLQLFLGFGCDASDFQWFLSLV